MKNNIKWICLTILIVLFLILMLLVINNKTGIFDNYIYSNIQSIISDNMTIVVKAITSLANPMILVIITIILGIYFGLIKNDKKTALLICINLLLIAVLNYGLKQVVGRDRPLDINLIEETGYSFPSGHSSASMAFYGYLMYIAVKNSSSKKKSVIVTSLFSIGILLIGLSRIYLGVHYASDVLAGFVLATIYLIVFVHITDIVLNKRTNKEKI